ncbi:MBL fold metallo-hydrolase [Dehalobacterium formicoaceticum]|uniref:MBL fold metallo-hydrolase n=1 Tax=Dehalobacterium formicoaceticum TaxID=51515 RepID=A0ABT1Y131_9FIRM|nr:MBL fold metallo-hydrolase [Dehalobacterium formicoaceticum]MCR6544231.1 MBL fold metallo-hydrolase [Dehalobacterium formicoaceticum]
MNKEIKEIFKNIYKIEIPLPQNPLKATNSYFISGTERNLLIDTGFNQPECRQAMDEARRKLGFSLDRTDLFVTHVHGDHCGLVGYLAEPKTKVYCGDYCAQALMGKHDWDQFEALIMESGLKAQGFSYDVSVHPGNKYASTIIPHAEIVEDGDILQVGNFTFHCILTTGHAPDHFCLYEPQHEILFSGDHILGKITPNNTIWGTPWSINVDYLGTYLENLEKIKALEIKTVLPGHRDLITNCNGRIEELKNHHQRRLQHILDIIGDGKMTGAQVASLMKWDIRANSWDDFPPAQKLFATGEALAHLTHLVFQDVLVKELMDGVVYYREA